MKVAIIGAGISGIGAALCLDSQHEVHLFEAEDRLGGHTRTISVHADKQTFDVDTGFIVFNHENYPHLTQLFDFFHIDTTQSNMSFGVSANDRTVEYSTDNLGHLLWHPQLKWNRHYWRMIRDIIRFNRLGKKFLKNKQKDRPLKEFISQHQFGPWFQNYFLLPMAGSIWSTPLAGILSFSTQRLLEFFDNHGLLSLFNQPQWYSVVGGSHHYLKAFAQSFKGTQHLNTQITQVNPQGSQLELEDNQGQKHLFDHIIFATHSDQASQCLHQHFPEKANLVKCIHYQKNHVICHQDTQFMPQDRGAWASWVYLQAHSNDEHISLTYWMNHLQQLPTQTPILVTLNPKQPPKPELILDECTLWHPVMNSQTHQHQEAIEAIQTHDNISFAGAWLGHGFHEDGLRSGIAAASKLGGAPPWQ